MGSGHLMYRPIWCNGNTGYPLRIERGFKTRGRFFLRATVVSACDP